MSRRPDEGATAILFAMTLTSLLGVAAIAIDLSAAMVERRHDQNAVDAAVMSAVVEAVLGGGVIDDVVAEVDLKAEVTLGRTITDEAWAGCEDDEQLHFTTTELQAGNPTISPVTDCISFSVDFSRVRVKLPDQPVEVAFAAALGFDALTVTADAEAQVVNGAGTGAPPFVALSTATTGDFICLRTSANPSPDPLLDGMGPGLPPLPGLRPDPCDDAAYDVSSENFGTLQPYRYLDGCTQQNADVEVAVSIGIDHIMGYYPDGYTPGMPERVDGGANCTVAFPNTFAIDTGFNAQGLRCALISNKNSDVCNGVAPRFQQGAFVQSTHRFAEEDIDNAAPWDFLRDAIDLFTSGAPKYCVEAATYRDEDDTFDPGGSPGIDDHWDHYVDPVHGTTFDHDDLDDADWDHHDRFDALMACLDAWTPGDPELFALEVGTTPRFAFIPKVHEADLDKVSEVHIESFVPTFMYRLYQSTSGGDTPCDPTDPRPSVPFFLHDAGGEYDCGSRNGNVDRLSSIVFACGMVPDALCNKDSGNPAVAGQDIYEFRLAS